MDEVRRFIRYTLPGLTCITVLLLALLISDRTQVISFLINVKEENAIGLILSTLLISGALGFILANIYFSILWLTPNNVIAIDHLNLLFKLNKYLSIVDENDKSINISTFSRREAWEIITKLWYWNKASLDNMKSMHEWLDRIIDLSHGIGAVLIGMIFSFVSWLFLHLCILSKLFNCKTDILVILLWIVIFIAFFINYYRTQKTIERLSNSIITKFIKEYFSKKRKKYKIYFSK